MSLESDLDALFEKYSIKEVEDILSNTRKDVERKKEELRVMVGERYRDLIEAADTISSMRASAENVHVNIGHMHGLCECLQQRGLIGFKTKIASLDNSRIVTESQKYSVAVQMKMLIDVPETLWNLTETKRILDAVQLLILSQQVHAGLRLSVHSETLLDQFPVITRQRLNIMQFKSSLAREATQLIQVEMEDPQIVLNALAAMMILEDVDMSSALRRYLDLRLERLLAITEGADQPTAMARTLLERSCAHFLSSLLIAHRCFYVEGNSADGCPLESLIRDVTGTASEPVSKPPISLLHHSSLKIGFLPKNVVDFRCSVKSCCRSLEGSTLREELEAWVSAAREKSRSSVAEILRGVNTIKGLTLIRKGINDVVRGHQIQNCDQVFSDLLGRAHFSVFDWLVRKESLARAKELVRNSLEDAVSALEKMVCNALKDIHSNLRASQEECDVTDFLWAESSSDIPDQPSFMITASSHASHDSPRSGLYCKSRCFTKKLQNICHAFDAKLEQVVEAIVKYESIESSNNIAFGVDEQYSEDFSEVVEFLESETFEAFKSFLANVNSMADDEHGKLMNHFELGAGESQPRQVDAPSSSSEVTRIDGLDRQHRLGEFIPPGGGDSTNPAPHHSSADHSALLSSPESGSLFLLSRLCLAVPDVCRQVRVCGQASQLLPGLSQKSLMLPKKHSSCWPNLVSAFKSASSSLSQKILRIHSKVIGSVLRNSLRGAFCSDDGHISPERLMKLFSVWDEVSIKEEGDSGGTRETTIRVPCHLSAPMSQFFTLATTSLSAACAHSLSEEAHSFYVSSLCVEILVAFEDSVESFTKNSQSAALQAVFDLRVIHNLLIRREMKELNERCLGLIRRLESLVDPFDLDVFGPHIATRVKIASQRLLVLFGSLIPAGKQPLLAKPDVSHKGNNSLPVISSLDIPRFSNVPIPVGGAKLKAAASELSLPEVNGLTDELRTAKVPRNSSSSSLSSLGSKTSSTIFSVVSSSWLGEYLNS